MHKIEDVERLLLLCVNDLESCKIMAKSVNESFLEAMELARLISKEDYNHHIDKAKEIIEVSEKIERLGKEIIDILGG